MSTLSKRHVYVTVGCNVCRRRKRTLHFHSRMLALLYCSLCGIVLWYASGCRTVMGGAVKYSVLMHSVFSGGATGHGRYAVIDGRRRQWKGRNRGEAPPNLLLGSRDTACWTCRQPVRCTSCRLCRKQQIPLDRPGKQGSSVESRVGRR